MAEFLRDESGVLSMEVEKIEVTSSLPKTDKQWRYTDHHGHEHYWQDGYPTLVEVFDETYWDEDDEDEYTPSHLECPQCGEHIAVASTLDQRSRAQIRGCGGHAAMTN